MVKIIVTNLETGKEIMNGEYETAIVGASNTSKENPKQAEMAAFMYGGDRDIAGVMSRLDKEVNAKLSSCLLRNAFRDAMKDIFGDCEKDTSEDNSSDGTKEEVPEPLTEEPKAN